MNGRIAKKIRKYSKHNFREYVDAVRDWPFANRWRLCWYILFSCKPKDMSKSQVWKARRPVQQET